MNRNEFTKQDLKTRVLRCIRIRWRRIKRLPWAVLLTLIVLMVASFVWSLSRTGNFEEVVLSFGTEMAGALATYALIDIFLASRREKEALIAQMGSNVRDVAVAAAEELNRRGWLRDGSLQGANLIGADLREANLGGADLRGANLSSVELRGAFLADASLNGAMAMAADLSEAWADNADFSDAFLHSSDLHSTNLEGADLREADLSQVNLKDADLEGSLVVDQQLAQAKSLASATLPDGTRLSEDEWEAEFEEWREKQEEEDGIQGRP